MKLITDPPWSEPPMFICCSVGNIRQIARPGPSGLNSSRPVAAAKLPRGKSPQLYHPGLSASGVAPAGTPTSSISSFAPVSSRHAARSAISFLVSAIALAGFSPLGQTFAQFMIVWQR